jgi:L-ribulose-5-phosphate 4-epimerase
VRSMQHSALREAVADANRALARAGLVTLDFGNASGVDRAAGVMVIKASGLVCATLRPEETVVVDIDTGRVLEDHLRPSSDTPTHLVLYRRFQSLGGVVHTHSPYASGWAQAGRPIPCFGTTHADHFRGSVPVTRKLTPAEVGGDYEEETGMVIVETFNAEALDATDIPGALVRGHGPFAWGAGPQAAVDTAVALEAVAATALHTLELNADADPLDDVLLERHFGRKHGVSAYYGQRGAK